MSGKNSDPLSWQTNTLPLAYILTFSSFFIPLKELVVKY